LEKLHFGDIVLLKFPFTDGSSFKRRPAVIIQDSRDGDIIVCRITSQIYQTNYDILIKEWRESGLKLPSIIRIHKIATLDKNLVELKIGEINIELKERIKEILTRLTE
jgi:mRNA interferase MazF